MKFKGKKIVLIGGAGFIGHNLAVSLKKKEADVHVFDSLQVNHLGEFSNTFNQRKPNETYIGFLNQRISLLNKHKIPLHVIDVRDYHLLSKHLDSIKPDVVLFLAAIAHANKANKDPYNTFDHSFRTLENSLDALKNSSTHFIFFSSSMVYGNFFKGEVDEKTQCNPLGIYGALKFSGEKLVIAYNQVFGMNYTIIRPSALYGERCVSRRVAQIFVENAIQQKDLIIQGSGNDSLDFTYVDDLIQGIELVIKKKTSRGEIFNLTYGQSVKIVDLANHISSKFSVGIKYKKKDNLMPERGTLNINLAKNKLGYSPKFDIYKGIDKYIDWYENNYKF